MAFKTNVSNVIDSGICWWRDIASCRCISLFAGVKAGSKVTNIDSIEAYKASTWGICDIMYFITKMYIMMNTYIEAVEGYVLTIQS